MKDCVPVEIAIPLPEERIFGNYSAGRFAWLLGNIQPIIPVPWKGSQGFFEVPDELLIPEPK